MNFKNELLTTEPLGLGVIFMFFLILTVLIARTDAMQKVNTLDETPSIKKQVKRAVNKIVAVNTIVVVIASFVIEVIDQLVSYSYASFAISVAVVLPVVFWINSKVSEVIMSKELSKIKVDE